MDQVIRNFLAKFLGGLVDLRSAVVAVLTKLKADRPDLASAIAEVEAAVLPLLEALTADSLASALNDQLAELKAGEGPVDPQHGGTA